MSRVASAIPAENDLLCESCGYTLNGLPDDSNCPECGKPIAESARELRHPPAWELTGRGFVTTTIAVLLRPAHFYRTFSTRLGNELRAARFSSWHFLLASITLTAAASAHLEWTLVLSAGLTLYNGYWKAQIINTLAGTLVTFFALKLLTRLAARLTAWEAAYRGLRLNYQMVLRGMHYHAAHYLPVALVAAITVFGFQYLIRQGRLPADAVMWYLYTLCAEVILGAVYLFWTYWIGMRNMMYANK